MSAPVAGSWSVNGRSQVGWRIDDLSAGREGMDFLRSPVAFVPREDLAHLIAALPDLLGSLKELVAHRDAAGIRPDGADGRYKRAREAIARAGELP